MLRACVLVALLVVSVPASAQSPEELVRAIGELDAAPTCVLESGLHPLRCPPAEEVRARVGPIVERGLARPRLVRAALRLVDARLRAMGPDPCAARLDPHGLAEAAPADCEAPAERAARRQLMSARERLTSALAPEPERRGDLERPFASGSSSAAATAASTPIERARACLTRGDVECAVQELTPHGDDERALALLVELHRARGDHAARRACMERYLARFPNGERAPRYRAALER